MSKPKRKGWSVKRIRRLNIELHRDVGYFFSALIIAYCISGLALNHIDSWNPDFIIEKKTITLPKSYVKEEINNDVITEFGKLAQEESFKVYDFPTADQVKIYYDNASLHVNLATREGVYEKVARRPLFYQANVLHRNSLKGWKWAADVFAIMLIFINITGLFVLKGKHGITGRGKWLVAAGFLPPIIALILHSMS
jgi:hypothetical protein